MKAKILKGKGKWYENRIGKTYVVKKIFKTAGRKRILIRNYRTIMRILDPADVKLIK